MDKKPVTSEREGLLSEKERKISEAKKAPSKDVYGDTNFDELTEGMDDAGFFVEIPGMAFFLSHSSDPLLEEVRKYKSAEEFVNSKDGEKAFFGNVVDDIKSKLPNSEVRITQNSIGVMKGNVRGNWMDNEDAWTFYPRKSIPEDFRVEIQKKIPGAKVMNGAIDFPKESFPSINQSQLTDLWNKAHSEPHLFADRSIRGKDGKFVGSSPIDPDKITADDIQKYLATSDARAIVERVKKELNKKLSRKETKKIRLKASDLF